MRGKILEQFMAILKESTLIQGAIALAVTITICYMYIVSLPVPSELYNVLVLILGFYFGTKSQARIMKG